MTVRRACPADVDVLARLRAAWCGTVADADFHAAFRAWHQAERATRSWWISFAADDAVGMVGLQRFTRMPAPGAAPSGWGYLTNLWVDPAHRGHGRGAALVDAVARQARSERLVRLVLSPSPASRPLYARAGFRRADELLVLALTADAP